MILLCLYSSYFLYPRNLPSIIFIYCHMTYKQEYTPYLYMEYISFSWSYISELVGPIMISLIEGCCWQGSYLINGYHWLSWSHHFGNFTVTSMTWLTVTNICVTIDHGYVQPVVSTFRFFAHSWFTTGFVTRVTRRVTLIEQELLTLPGHFSSSWFLVGLLLLDI